MRLFQCLTPRSSCPQNSQETVLLTAWARTPLEAQHRSGNPGLCGAFCVMFNGVHAGPERPNLRVGYHSASAPNGRNHARYPGGAGGLLTSCQGDNIGLESGL